MAVESTALDHFVDLPGRLGNPESCLATDPRADPRMVAAFAVFGLDQRTGSIPVSPESARDEQLAFAVEAEARVEETLNALFAGLPPVEGVESETITTAGGGGNEIKLYIHRPVGVTGPLPCVYHIHGGAMLMLQAGSVTYTRWRDELAAAGLIVIGVEFRNGAGKLGAFPFPAGLDDCVAGLRWVLEHRDDLGVSSVVVSGESGGANLSMGVTRRAKREGWVSEIAGVYAQCPYISNAWATMPPELPSLHENDGYFVSCERMAVWAEVYDPGGAHADDPSCWPYLATAADLAGLPPHMISVNELDPVRDEGLAYFRRLLAAGVSATSRTVNGICHVGDLYLRAAVPDVFDASVRDIKSFADTVTPK